MCGGTSNIWSGETGADLYTEEVAYAAAARAAGFWKVMIMTLCPNSTNTGPQETQRSSHNTLLIADASHGFDAVVDIASDSRLSDPTSSTYYVQGGFTSGVHWTAAGAAVAASLVGPAADAVLATG
jgi:hypothetical protein